jgi:hypothetical protein
MTETQEIAEAILKGDAVAAFMLGLKRGRMEITEAMKAGFEPYPNMKPLADALTATRDMLNNSDEETRNILLLMRAT